MTSTHTYQGMDKDMKPTSRVLAPPGGGSSNIFGVDSPAPAKQPPRSQPPAQQENILGQPQQNSGERNIRGAPKQGENSFSTLFGSSSSQSTDTTPSKGSRQTDLKSDNRTPSSARSNCSRKNQDTFMNVFGDPGFQPEPYTPKNHAKKDDSFSRVFAGEPASPQQIKPYNGIETLSLNDSSSQRSESSRASSKPNASDSSFNRVFGEFQGDSKPSVLKTFTDTSAFNPITGEPYGSTPTKNDSKSQSEEQKQDVEESENQDVAEVKVPSTENGQQKAPSAFPTAAETKEHTSTRVLNPPGGRSTKLW